MVFNETESFPWGLDPGGTQKQTERLRIQVLQGGAGFWKLKSPPQIYLPEERRMKSKPGGSQMAGRAGRGVLGYFHGGDMV